MKKYQIGIMVGHNSFIPHGELLIKSIRNNGGLYHSCPISILTPKHAKVMWKNKEAKQIEFDVPLELRTLPFADKMIAAAFFEKRINGPYIWLDVDSIVLHEPKEWDLDNRYIGIKPVDKRNIGCLYEETITSFWKEIYKYFNLNTDVFPVYSTVGEEKIKPYFNVGMVVIKKHKDLFTKVVNAIINLLKNPIIIKKIHTDISHRIFFHQAVFSVATLAEYPRKNIYLMNYQVNYPLHYREQYPHYINFKDLETIRYDTYFEKQQTPIELVSLVENNESSLKINWYYD